MATTEKTYLHAKPSYTDSRSKHILEIVMKVTYRESLSSRVVYIIKEEK